MVESKFKKTDIGLIPEDWSIANWNDVFDFKSTASYSRAAINIQGNVGYIHYGDIYTKIKAILDINKFVSGYISNKQVKTYTIIKEGDLIMADASEDQSGIGKSFEVINQPHNPVISGLHTFLIREKKNCVLAKGFKAYFYFNPLIKKQYDALATGLKVYSLAKGSFNHIQIPLPPLPEQQAIAKVLSETDNWIDSLENIIAKKSQVKQGAMQMLLTPNVDWEVKKLGNIGNTIGGLSGKTKIDFGKGNSFYIPFMNIMKNVIIDANFLDTVNIKSGEFQNKLLKNDLLFNGSSETPEELGISSVLLESIDNLYLNSFSFGFRLSANSNVYPLFLSYLMRSNYGRKIIYHLAQGATRYNLSKANFLNLEIAFPKSLKEQTRIANLLSDMDAEIENLEKKLTKAKQLKQGMMQQLLTGKIRLINSLQTS